MTQQELLTNENIGNKVVGFEGDYCELVQLNHRVMARAHEIHNNNIQRKDK